MYCPLALNASIGGFARSDQSWSVVSGYRMPSKSSISAVARMFRCIVVAWVVYGSVHIQMQIRFSTVSQWFESEMLFTFASSVAS